MSTLSKEQLPWLVVALFLGIAIGALAVIFSGRNRPAPIYITPASPTDTPPPTPTAVPSPTASPLRVHLSGEVGDPDVYVVPAGAILRDAIEAAGGLTGEAAADMINLALPLALKPDVGERGTDVAIVRSEADLSGKWDGYTPPPMPAK